GSYTYTWSVNGGVIDSGQGTETPRIRWSSIGGGLLRLSVTDPATKCADTTSLAVVISSGYTPSVKVIGDTLLCEGESVTLEADAGYQSYEWNTGERTRSLLVTKSGSYRVHVSDTVCDGW